MRLRLFAVGTAVAAVVLLTAAAPAGATASNTSRSASAFWVLNDAWNSHVSLQGSEPASGGNGSLFLFVTQSQCDTNTDEMVLRSWVAQGPLRPNEFHVLPNLKAAGMNTTKPVSGSEQRSPNCASPGNPTSFTSLGTSNVTIQVGWQGVGPVYTVQPGVTGRAAVADGRITGSQLNLGRLGPSQTAELRSTTV
jgi:hypothetical protein